MPGSIRNPAPIGIGAPISARRSRSRSPREPSRPRGSMRWRIASSGRCSRAASSTIRRCSGRSMSQRDAKVAQRAAEQGIVLLRNEKDLLPLSSRLHSIAVIGGHADIGVLSGGGSSQVIPIGGPALRLEFKERRDTVPYAMIFDPSSPLQAIAAQAPGATDRVRRRPGHRQSEGSREECRCRDRLCDAMGDRGP